MIKLSGISSSKSFDDFAIKELGYPSIVLMENAAENITNLILKSFTSINAGLVAGIFCGKGNNGGDGFAVARKLILKGVKVNVFYLHDPAEFSNDCKLNFTILQSIITPESGTLQKLDFNDQKQVIGQVDFIIDALLGTGTRGNPLSPYLECINLINSLSKPVLSVDIPSGLSANSTSNLNIVKADVTASLGTLKLDLFTGHGIHYAGKIEHCDIGVPAKFIPGEPHSTFLLEKNDIVKGIPVKKRNLNKYSAGKLSIFAGSEKYPGAALLVSNSALRSGCGAPRLFTESYVKEKILPDIPDLVVSEMRPEKLEEEKFFDSDAFLIGPGISLGKQNQELVLNLVKNLTGKRVVLDADGLAPFYNERFKDYDLSGFVLTPHFGEFGKLLGINSEELNNNLIEKIYSFCESTKAFLVLKGINTIICTGKCEIYISNFGNSGLAKFGSGDVLSGILASFLAQGREINELERRL
ncbi:MAG: NAD(P)H-hydrate dehydratase, partial [Ignavibacteriaceae bacterium]|nr:NAD(P)H-hydrate dehydratase [Ignavibacteriaceae bacterium]